VSLLLDTHVIVWWFHGDRRMSPRLRDMIENYEGKVCVSAISAFEMAQKFRLGKWPEVAPFMEGFGRLVQTSNLVALPVSPLHAMRAGLLASDHRDPFDRIIVAQSMIEGLRIVSRDSALKALGAETLW
jgi:PIN domain nuclease of toxin-antitoxin system